MNGARIRTVNEIAQDCSERYVRTYGDADSDTMRAEWVESTVRDALNEYADRIDNAVTIIRNGGSFGLTYAQKRILLEALGAKA